MLQFGSIACLECPADVVIAPNPYIFAVSNQVSKAVSSAIIYRMCYFICRISPKLPEKRTSRTSISFTKVCAGETVDDSFISIDNLKGIVSSILVGSGYATDIYPAEIDVLISGKRDDRLCARREGDILKGGVGNNTLHGGDGFDSALYLGSDSMNFTIKDLVGADWKITDNRTGEVDTLISSEALRSNDMDIFA